MLKSYWLSLPFILQMLLMAIDEFWFHRKRGLPRWERIGHPLDTLTVLLCIGWALYAQPNRQTMAIFGALAILSCVFITKDEPVHKRCCLPAEMWLHALLFILHPIALVSAALLWLAVAGPSAPVFPRIVLWTGFERGFLGAVCALMVGFGIYQAVFWNFLWRPKETAS